MQGTTPAFCDEQTQVDNDAHKVFTIDGENVTTNFTFGNNNIFWTQDVLDFYASNDTVSVAGIFSQEIVKALGGDAAAEATYISEPLELNSVPTRILQLVKDTYADPASTEMFDLIVEDISRQGTAYDSGNIFDFSTFDAAYDPSSQSAKGGADGSTIGAVYIRPTAISGLQIDRSGFSVYPNPASNNVVLSYTNLKTGNVKLSLYDISGKEKLVLVNETQSEGQQQINISNIKSELNSGIYLIRLVTEYDQSIKKLIIN